MKIRHLIAGSAASLLFVACASTAVSPGNQGSPPDREAEARGAAFPRVVSPGWHVMGDGKPCLDVTGFYRVSWARDGAPGDVVDVFYHGGRNPRIETDDPSTVTVMGKNLQTYDSGNEDPAFATQPVLLTAPDGRSAYYSFQFNNARLHRTRAIPRFGW